MLEFLHTSILENITAKTIGFQIQTETNISLVIHFKLVELQVADIRKCINNAP